MNRRPQMRMVAPGASAEEAAAITAALEQFMRDTAPAPAPAAEPALSRWKRSALEEGVACRPDPAGAGW